MAEAAATMGLREFAASRGWKASYVTELKAAGRLVLTADGRKVVVADSLRLIADTSDPAKVGVAARHAAARGASAAASTSSPPENEEGDIADLERLPPNSAARRRAEILVEISNADLRQKLRDEAKELGSLLDADDVRAAVADAVMVFRTALQNLPATLPLVEERDRPVVADGIEHVLGELERKFGAIGRAA